jgi:hypothetical protein
MVRGTRPALLLTSVLLAAEGDSSEDMERILSDDFIRVK